MDRLPIQKTLIPYSFDIVLGGFVYTLRVDYNAAAGLFTVALSRDGTQICAGEPLVYGVPLFRDVYQAGEFPALSIVPWDAAWQSTAVTWENFGETVFLCVDRGEGVGLT